MLARHSTDTALFRMTFGSEMRMTVSIILTVALCGCVSGRHESSNVASRWLFLELKTLNTEHVIKRPDSVFDSVAIVRCLDFPTYRFEKRSGILRGAFDFQEDTPIVGILGRSHSLRGSGTGTASRLFPIPAIPFTKDLLVIQQLESDGSVSVVFGTNSFSLAAGQEWSQTKTHNRAEAGIEYAVTDKATVINHGFLGREDIVWFDPHYSKFKRSRDEATEERGYRGKPDVRFDEGA